MGSQRIMVCIHHYSIIHSTVSALNILCAPLSYTLYPIPVIINLFTVSRLAFPECNSIEIIHYVAFSDWLSLTNMQLTSFMSSGLESAFLFSAE